MVDVQASESGELEVSERYGGLWPRVGAACGLAFVVLQSAALGFMSSAGWLDPGASRVDILRLFSGTPSSALWIGQYLSVLAGLAFIPFAASVVYRLRRTEGEPGWVSTVAVAGAVLLVASELCGAGAVNALLSRAGHSLSSSEAMTLFDLAQALLFLFWAGAVLFLGASAVLSFRLRSLPRWLGGAAAFIAAVSLVAPVSSQYLHIPATLFYVWVVAASVTLMRSTGAPRMGEQTDVRGVSTAH
jgi:hypothetical protein